MNKSIAVAFAACALLLAPAFSRGALGDYTEFADKTNWTVTVSGNGDGQGAAAIINGDETDMWQCDWRQDAWFCIDLGSRRTIRAFRYRPRDRDHSMKDYKFWVLDAPVTSYDDVAALPSSHAPASAGVLPYTNDPTYIEADAPQVGRYVVMQSFSTYAHSAGCREFWLYGENAVVPVFSIWPASKRLYATETATFTLSASDHAAGVLYADLAVTNPASALASIVLGGADVTAGGMDVATFTAGACDQGALSVAASALAGNAAITLSEGSSTLGALPRSASIESVARKVRLVGSTNIGVGIGATVNRTLQIVDSELAAPGAIPLAAGTPSAGTVAVSGDGSIASGAFASSAPVAFTGVSEGTATILLTLGNNFVFEETGTSTITLTVSTLGDTLYVSPDGDDDNLGSADFPLRSISAAAAFAMDGGMDIEIAAGLYSAASGETFPILPPNGIEIRGVAGATRTPADSTVIDCGGAGGFSFPDTPDGAGLLSGLVITNAGNYAVDGNAWFGTMANCIVDGVDAASDDGAIFSIDTYQTDLLFTNCVFRNVTTSGQYWFRCIYTRGPVTLADCTFRNLDITGGGGILDKTGPIVFQQTRFSSVEDPVRILRCVFDDLVVDRTTGDPHSSGNYFENGVISPWAKTWVDRCVFRHASAPFAYLGGNRGELHVYNSLFYDIDCGDWGVAHVFYNAELDVRNCTFDQVGAVFHTDAYHAITTARNLSISSSAKLNSMDGTRLVLQNCNVYDTPLADAYNPFYDTASSANVTAFTPDYVAPYDAANPGAADYRLWPYSELVDIGDNASIDANYALDLAGKPRAYSAEGDAVVDLGAYESRFGAPDTVSFYTPGVIRHVFVGESIAIPVCVNPAPEAATPVQASVSLGTDLSTETPALAWTTGSETNSLVVTAAETLSQGDGERMIVAVSESGTSVGIDPLAVGVYLHEKRVTLDRPARLYVRQGTTNDIPVKIYSDGAVASAAIPIVAGEAAGAGSNEIGWVGTAEIAAGDSVSDGVLRIVGGAGVNTVTVTVGIGFRFAGSDSSTTTLEVVGYPGALYVDAALGDDDGYGTLETPFQTIAHAITESTVGDTIRILPGTYGAASGETFPLVPDGLLLQGYNATGDVDRAGHILDGGNAVANLIALSAPKHAAGLENLWLRESTEAAISADAATIAMTNLLFTQSYANNGNYACGGATMRNDSQLCAVDCCFTGMTRVAAAVGVTAHKKNTNSNFHALRCEFLGNTSVQGTVAQFAGPEVAGRFFLADCLFQGNHVPDTGMGDGYSSSAIFIWGRHHLPSIIEVDRCRFIGNSGGSLISISNTAGGMPRISNSLFAGNSTPCCMFLGYSWKMDVHNCTFVGNTGGYAARACNRDNHGMHIYNSILCDEETLTFASGWGDSGAPNLRLHDTIVYHCGAGEGYDAANSSNVIDADPGFANIAVPATDPAFNARLASAGSPAVDAGVNANAFGTLDLDGAGRIRKGPGGLYVDLGCYERFNPPAGTILLMR
jgi:hypothetical protein